MFEKCKCADVGLLLIRLGLAAIFIAHGASKFMDLTGTAAFFGSIGLAPFFAYLVAGVELLAGIAVLLGIFTFPAGLLLAAVMVFAIFLVKIKGDFLGGYELDFMLLAAALGIALTGPGKYAVAGSCSCSKECKACEAPGKQP